jgi:hypothetical protein
VNTSFINPLLPIYPVTKTRQKRSILKYRIYDGGAIQLVSPVASFARGASNVAFSAVFSFFVCDNNCTMGEWAVPTNDPAFYEAFAAAR